jgi:adenylate cyclase
VRILRWFWGSRGRRQSVIVGAYGLAALFFCLTFAAINLPVLERFQMLVFDAYQRLQPRPESQAPILLVDIDEASILELGQWPWPRSALAEIVDRLGELGAAAVTFDMVFPEPDRTSPARIAAALQEAGIDVVLPAGTSGLDNDAVLAEAFRRNNVIAGFAVSNETDAALAPSKSAFAFGQSSGA